MAAQIPLSRFVEPPFPQDRASVLFHYLLNLYIAHLTLWRGSLGTLPTTSWNGEPRMFRQMCLPAGEGGRGGNVDVNAFPAAPLVFLGQGKNVLKKVRRGGSQDFICSECYSQPRLSTVFLGGLVSQQNRSFLNLHNAP